MPNALSIFTKQQLSRDSNSPLLWVDLDSKDRRIVMAICFEGSPEDARKHLQLSIGGFYKRWKYLKPVYNSLLSDLPNQAVNILKAGATKAALTLVQNLEAENPADQIKSANSVLDRVTPERTEIQKGVKRTLSVIEFISMPEEEIQNMRSSQ